MRQTLPGRTRAKRNYLTEGDSRANVATGDSFQSSSKQKDKHNRHQRVKTDRFVTQSAANHMPLWGVHAPYQVDARRVELPA